MDLISEREPSIVLTLLASNVPVICESSILKSSAFIISSLIFKSLFIIDDVFISTLLLPNKASNSFFKSIWP